MCLNKLTDKDRIEMGDEVSTAVTILDGITIGGVGGAIAGLMVWCTKQLTAYWEKEKDCKTVYGWLKDNTSKGGIQFRSTRAIASHNNLTMDRVRYICSVDDRMFLSTAKREDMWALHEHASRSDSGLIKQAHVEL